MSEPVASSFFGGVAAAALSTWNDCSTRVGTLFRETLWGEETDLAPANGPLANLWRYWGDGFEAKSQSAAFFIIGAAIPLAVQHWLSPNPTLTATATTLSATLSGLIWNQGDNDDRERTWNNGICNPLFLGAMLSVAGLDLWQLGNCLLTPATLPFWSVGRALQLTTLGFSGLILGSELFQGSRSQTFFS